VTGGGGSGGGGSGSGCGGGMSGGGGDVTAQAEPAQSRYSNVAPQGAPLRRVKTNY